MNLPLLFSATYSVTGEGYVAKVTMHGRILACQEGDRWALYSSLPGGASGEGDTPREALAEFHRGVQEVLDDCAAGADYVTFRAEVERFFSEATEETDREWWEAVARAREAAVLVPGLPTKAASSPRSVVVEKVDRPVLVFAPPLPELAEAA